MQQKNYGIEKLLTNPELSHNDRIDLAPDWEHLSE